MRYVAIRISNDDPEVADVNVKTFADQAGALKWMDSIFGNSVRSGIIAKSNPNAFRQDDLIHARPAWFAVASDERSNCIIVRATEFGRTTVSLSYEKGYGMCPTRYEIDQVFRKPVNARAQGVSVRRTPMGLSITTN